MREEIDRDAFGPWPVPRYGARRSGLLQVREPRHGGVSDHDAAVERCTLPIVPLLETITQFAANKTAHNFAIADVVREKAELVGFVPYTVLDILTVRQDVAAQC
jgi:hypothetical protein